MLVQSDCHVLNKYLIVNITLHEIGLMHIFDLQLKLNLLGT